MDARARLCYMIEIAGGGYALGVVARTSTSTRLLWGDVLVFLILERFFPAERQQLTAAVFNLLFALAGYVFITLQAYFFGKLFTFVLVTRQDWLTSVNFVHQQLGFVEFCWRLPIYLLVIDFLSYWEHRALHRIPILWRLHKLHHSDRNVNASTARREHWLSDGVYMITILAPGAVMFGALDLPVAALIAYMATGFYNHANIRLHLGKLTAIVSGPQFHRIHHSILPEHYDKNFSGLFPIFDILFGTYHRPSRNEFPPTGLTDERIESQWVAHFGPFSPLGAIHRVRKPLSGCALFRSVEKHGQAATVRRGYPKS